MPETYHASPSGGDLIGPIDDDGSRFRLGAVDLLQKIREWIEKYQIEGPGGLNRRVTWLHVHWDAMES